MVGKSTAANRDHHPEQGTDRSKAKPVPVIRPARPGEDGGLDRLIYERVRLGIMSALATNEALTFNELKDLFNVSDGNVYHIDPSLMRFGPMRPAMGLADYKSPVDGLFLGSGGMHPSAGICGLPGQLAARTMNRELGKASGFRRLIPARLAATARNGHAKPSPAVPAVSDSLITH